MTMQLRTLKLRAPVLLNEGSSRGVSHITIGTDGVTDIQAYPSGVVVASRNGQPWLWVHGDNWGYVSHQAPVAKPEDPPPTQVRKPRSRPRKTVTP